MPPTRSNRPSTSRNQPRQVSREVLEISDDDDHIQTAKFTRRRRRFRKPVFIDLSELPDDDDDDKDRPAPANRDAFGPALDEDDGTPFPEALPPPVPAPSYEQNYAEMAPRMRALGAPEWAVQMSARLMYKLEYKLDYELCIDLDKCIDAGLNVTHAFSSMNKARGDGAKESYVLCPFRNGKYPCSEPVGPDASSPTALGDRNELELTYQREKLDEPPEWFMKLTGTIGEALSRLYEDTDKELAKTQAHVQLALTMMTNVFVRRAGLNTGYSVVPFVDGCGPPSELPPLVSDDAVNALSHEERKFYLSGYGITDWNESNWRPQLFDAIGAPIDLDDDEDAVDVAELLV
ncbi:hypothetical protein HDZ31DRAFT_60497 [Schizophyllum fasciatum]